MLTKFFKPSNWKSHLTNKTAWLGWVISTALAYVFIWR